MKLLILNEFGESQIIEISNVSNGYNQIQVEGAGTTYTFENLLYMEPANGNYGIYLVVPMNKGEEIISTLYTQGKIDLRQSNNVLLFDPEEGTQEDMAQMDKLCIDKKQSLLDKAIGKMMGV